MPKKNLTIKQRRFVKEYVATGNATGSALSAYNVKNYNVAKSIGQENLTKPYLIEEINSLMEGRGITDEKLLEKLEAGLAAVKIVEYKGKLVETNIPDLQLQHKFLDTALRLKDMYPSQRVESRSINVDLELERMSDLERKKLIKEVYAGMGYGDINE